MKKRIFVLVGVLLVVCMSFLMVVSVSNKSDIPERPTDTTVLDESGILTSASIGVIDRLNRNWEDTDQGLQVGVYVTDTLNQDIESLSNEIFRKWQIGFSETNNGVLLVVAIEDREFRIETSDNAATVLPDVEAKRILDNSRDFFREEEYDKGIVYIVQAIGDRFYGTNLGQAQLAELEEETSLGENIFSILGIVIFVIIVVVASGGGRGGPGGWLWLLLGSANSHRYHSSDSSSSVFGSGGWSGGGGGGGGASSGW